MRWSRASAEGNKGVNGTARGEGEGRKTQTERKAGATLLVPVIVPPATEQITAPPKPKPRAYRSRPPVGPTSLCIVTLPRQEEFARHKGLGLGLDMAAKFGQLHLPFPIRLTFALRRHPDLPSRAQPATPLALLPWNARRGLIASKGGEASPASKTEGREKRTSPSARPNWLLRIFSPVSAKQQCSIP